MTAVTDNQTRGIATANPETIARAATLLQNGELVAFPTETVYGLGADATNSHAVAGIFKTKQRPDFNPLIVHVGRKEDIAKLVEINDVALRLIEKFWPGPLTLILPRLDGCPVSELCSAGLPTLAIRMPAHKTAQTLLKKAGRPIAAPSANRSGQLSPTTPKHVADSLGADAPFILADGPCTLGLESTVIDLSADTPVILRPGGVTPDDISHTLGQTIDIATPHGSDDTAPRSPGLTLRHYAPRLPLRLNAVDLKPGEALLAFGSDKFMGIQGGGSAKDLPEDSIRNLSPDQDLHEAAANLFRMLHDLDAQDGTDVKHNAIAVMAIPETGLGLAINDRLRRAATAQLNDN